MHVLRQTQTISPFTSIFKRALSVHLMNNAWVDNFNSCLQRSIPHERAPCVSSPVLFIHTHQVPGSLKEIFYWALWNIVCCKKVSNTPLVCSWSELYTTQDVVVWSITTENKQVCIFISATLGQWTRAIQKCEELDIFLILHAHHFKSGELSDEHFTVRLGMIYIYEVLTQMMCFLSDLHVFSKDIRCNTLSWVKSCFEIRKAGSYFVQCRTYNIKPPGKVTLVLRTAH